VINDNENNEIEHLLLNVEPTSIFENLDIRSLTTNSRPEFPSEEFGDFMALLTKWNLSDACGSDILKFSHKISREEVKLPTSVKQGRQLLDQINVPHISFKKDSIMVYNQETYFLYHRYIFDAVKELLSDQNILQCCVFDFKPLYHDGQQIYHELYNGEWWERVQRSLPREAKVLSIILYSDAMTCDHLGKTSEHPIYLTLGNLPSWDRNKPNAKVLLGYLPQLKAKTISQKRSKGFQLAKRSLYQYALDILTRPLLDYKDDGFDLKMDNGELWCYPFISALLGDLPESAALTLTFNSVNCKYSCHKCLTEVDDLNNTKLNNN
jgi:hypothetical protein